MWLGARGFEWVNMMFFENGFSVDELLAVAQEKWRGFIEIGKGVPCGNSGFVSAELVGVVPTLPRAKDAAHNEPLAVVSVRLPEGVQLGARSSRKRQFEFAKNLIQAFASNPPCALKGSIAHGLFAFSDDDGNFRLSLVTSHYDAKAKQEFGSFRRQSFYVEAGKSNTTFRRYFLARSATACATLADVREAFSVEALTEEFYTEIEKWFLWARKKVTFPKPSDSHTNDEEHQSTQTLRLITRLIFIWFLKEKHLVPTELFDRKKINELLNFGDKSKSTYYKAILQNLFFATLNTPLNKRAWVCRQAGKQEFFRYKRYFKNDQKFEYLVNICGRVPFVNGGLFENLDGKNEDGSPDETRRLDCFSNRLDNQSRLVVPDELFLSDKDVHIKVPTKSGVKDAVTTGILTTLARYDFTITENSPSDEDVSLDPELLGRVFENLLAYVNPETSEQARKATGSFYTPREIVNYMVDEALNAYLGDASKLTPSQLKTRLMAVRVLDPACGSGAFPMGILTRIIELLEDKGALNPDDADAVYQTKLDLIKNCIYGVDIQNIAVQISKLRFFISLLCEQKTNDKASDNFGVSVLPNLETKFVAANSLIAKKKRSVYGELFEDPEISKTQRELDDLRNEHFSAQTSEKKQRIRKADEKARQKLAKLVEANGIFAPADAKQIALWNPYDPNATSSFFDPEMMFGIKGGFDIVIGNPPYGAKSTKEDVAYYKQNYQVSQTVKGIQKGSTDTFAVFIERGYMSLKKGGSLCYIVPMSLTSSDAMSGVHNLLMKNCETIKISSYAVRPQPVFKNAMVNTSIMSCVKTLSSVKELFSTKMHRKTEGVSLKELVDNLKFVDVLGLIKTGRIPKISDPIEKSILQKLLRHTALKEYINPNGNPIFYRTSGGRYFKIVTNFSTGSTKENSFLVQSKYSNAITCLLSSSLSFWFYQVYSNNLDWKFCEISDFSIPDLKEKDIVALEKLLKIYLADIEANATVQKKSGSSSYKVDKFKVYEIGKSKHIIDQIDDLICPLYGLTKEETEFIKNYEIKFRLDDSESSDGAAGLLRSAPRIESATRLATLGGYRNDVSRTSQTGRPSGYRPDLDGEDE